MPKLTINGLDTYYEISGEGETVVLLHNGFSCGMMWEEVAPMLVENGFRVLVYDRRGYGRSDGGVDFADHYVSATFRREGMTALAELLDRLEIDRVHLVGQCEGGVVGADYAVDYPDRVHTLVAASTPVPQRHPHGRIQL